MRWALILALALGFLAGCKPVERWEVTCANGPASITLHTNDRDAAATLFQACTAAVPTESDDTAYEGPSIS